MAIRNYLIISLIIIFGCDPATTRTFTLRNGSIEHLRFIMYKRNQEAEVFSIPTSNENTIFSRTSTGGSFGIVASYDSIELIVDNQSFIWKKPDHPYGYIDESNKIGVSRDLYLDFYNKKDWVEKIGDDTESWTFVITDTVLENLFED